MKATLIAPDPKCFSVLGLPALMGQPWPLQADCFASITPAIPLSCLPDREHFRTVRWLIHPCIHSKQGLIILGKMILSSSLKKKKVQVFKKCSYTLCSTTPFLRIYTTEIIAVLNNSRQRYMCRDVGCSIVCNYGKEREPTQESIKRGLGNKRRRSHTMQC